ncbi:MAG: carbamoyltransferase HypF [Gammaproteobacteria bacterium]|nr:carbamoyltransferase HypF [Gammaproteobacteria bacterium]
MGAWQGGGRRHRRVTGAMGNEIDPMHWHDTRNGDAIVCWRLRVRGRVQGVGFRPFVYRCATKLALSGWIRNDAGGVVMEVQGPLRSLGRLVNALYDDAPPLARVEQIEMQECAVAADRDGFAIHPSTGGRINTAIPTDAATCDECLTELFDPGNRRYRYPFINCSHCGPRYSIVTAMPYDRQNTAMARFALCAPCQTEYEGPADRRFHAEPVACAACGPRLVLCDGSGQEQAVGDAVAAAWSLMRDGAIVAVKGIGGFHLMCDARNAATVAALRRRKRRPDKPFALLALNAASIRHVVRLNESEQSLLEDVDRPIVLLRKTADCDERLAGVAHGLDRLGVMLAYTPVHYLLFHEAAGRPPGTDWLHGCQETLFVCTSANPGSEPLVIGNEEAMARLGGLADAFLVHDRAIVSRCDDGVVRASARDVVWLRRGRGQAPSPIRLPRSGPPVLAVGAMLKNTICLTRHDEAFVSPHVGDLGSRPAYQAFQEAAASLTRLLGVRPQCVAHDLHPDYPNTRHAERLAAQDGILCIAVQHHHAHIAAVLAEHGVSGPALGVALDGAGYGADGGIWGGELLSVQGARFTRVGHLAPLPLPGGDRATREPWRMAASALHVLGYGDEIGRRFHEPAAAVVAGMLKRRINAPLSCSAGRLFDAAAGLLGLCAYASYEGQAAMMLEGLAARFEASKPLDGGYTITDDGEISFLPTLDFLRTCPDPATGAAIFHATLAAGLAAWIGRAMERTGIRQVALAGGCFANGILQERLYAALEEQKVTVYGAVCVPPNDGGLSLGQAWVAMCAMQEGV